MKKIEKLFESAVTYANDPANDLGLSNDQKLELYALYKQATEGDVTGKKPSRMNIVARTKFIGREKLIGMSSENAMTAYIDFVDSFKN
jgi:acyl-CoA-binding protein